MRVSLNIYSAVNTYIKVTSFLLVLYLESKGVRMNNITDLSFEINDFLVNYNTSKFDEKIRTKARKILYKEIEK